MSLCDLSPAFLFEFPTPVDLDMNDPVDRMIAAVSARLLTSPETYTLIMESWGDISWR